VTPRPPTALCVMNYAAGFGFAQHFFEVLYARVADRLVDTGWRTLVGYPTLDGEPVAVRGSPEQTVAIGTKNAQLLAVVRRENVRAMCFIDRHAWDGLLYARLHAAGVRQIVVYNETSGSGWRTRGAKRLALWMIMRLPWLTADTLACVSEFVARREIENTCIPRRRVVRVYNGIDPPDATAEQAVSLDGAIPPGRPVILACCRAVPEKGVDYLFRAFDQLVAVYPAERARPVLVYIGDGRQREELETLRRSLPCGESIYMLGYRADAAALARTATISVVPSVWEEAFGLAVIEPMARGTPVIATRVGAIPEIIDSEAVGLLVPPRDPAALAAAMRTLLEDPDRCRAIGERARQRVATAFRFDTQVAEIAALLSARAAAA
jgi:glycosyltransferase involved in cell wall biosynthesis